MDSKTIIIGKNVDFDWLEKELKSVSFLDTNNAPSVADLIDTLVDLSVTELRIEHDRILVKFPKKTLTLEEVIIFAQGLNADEMEVINMNGDCISLWWD